MIEGTSHDLELRIGELVGDLIPPDSKLKVLETESKRSTGSTMFDEGFEYFGELRVVLVVNEKTETTLARLISENSSSIGSGGAFHWKDAPNYRYKLTEDAVKDWFPRL